MSTAIAQRDIPIQKAEKAGGARLDYLDIAKGITILLVIVGHTFPVWKVKVNWIFTFHMPLFFILSGYFFKSGRKTNYKKLVKALIIPYWGLNLAKVFLTYMLKIKQIDVSRELLGVFYGNASNILRKAGPIDAPIIGMTWFLLALFWCRIIYNELDKLAEKYGFSMFWTTVILAFAGMELNTKICLPFSIMPGITAMLFYHIGRVIRERKIFDIKLKEIPAVLIILSLVLWECCCLHGMIRLNGNKIKLIMDIFSAVIGTFYVVKISAVTVKIPLLGTFFKWCGRNSIVIYGLHSLDSIAMFYVRRFIPTFNNIGSWLEYYIYLGLNIGIILSAAFAFTFLRDLIKEKRTKKQLYADD